MFKILLSNDDGIYTVGIRMLAKVLAEIAAITVVAPDRDRSGASNSLTLDAPLRATQIEENYYLVQGTPTDCVHLATSGLLPELPDMVVAGINDGANLGDDIFYSGTVAAAMEGRFMGYPSVAVSLAGPGKKKHFTTAALVTKLIIEQIRTNKLPEHTILNVNVPDLPYEELNGFALTRLGTRHRAENCVLSQDPRGNDIYWIGPPGLEQDAGPGTDFHAISEKKVSITPVMLDLTHYKSFNQLTEWVDTLAKTNIKK